MKILLDSHFILLPFNYYISFLPIVKCLKNYGHFLPPSFSLPFCIHSYPFLFPLSSFLSCLSQRPPPAPHCPGLLGRWEGLSCWVPLVSPSFLPGWHWSFLPRVPIGHCPQGSNSGGVGDRGTVGPGTWPLRPWVLCP